MTSTCFEVRVRDKKNTHCLGNRTDFLLPFFGRETMVVSISVVCQRLSCKIETWAFLQAIVVSSLTSIVDLFVV